MPSGISLKPESDAQKASTDIPGARHTVSNGSILVIELDSSAPKSVSAGPEKCPMGKGGPILMLTFNLH